MQNEHKLTQEAADSCYDWLILLTEPININNFIEKYAVAINCFFDKVGFNLGSELSNFMGDTRRFFRLFL